MCVKTLTKDKNVFRLLIIFVLVFAMCSILKPDLFLQTSNFQSMSKQFPEFGLLSIGIGLTLLTGGIDLSAVSIANLSAIMAATLMQHYLPKGSTAPAFPVIVMAVCISVITAVICGAINGFLISRIGIPPILATLGTQQLFIGIAIVATKGKPISGLPMAFAMFMNKNILGIPIIALIFLVAAIIVGIILSKTKIGRSLYLLGTNSIATTYAGLSNTRLLIFTYSMSAVMASLAGLIMMGRSNSAKADYGASYTLQCVLIAVLGGINPNGGKGNIQGIVMAVLILQMMSSGLNMFENISNFYRDLIWGLLLIIVLIANYVIDKKELSK